MYEGAGTSGHDSTPTPASTTQSGPTTASGPTTESGPTTPTTGPTTPEPPSSGPEPDPASEPDAAPATLDLTGPALGVVEGFARWLAALAPGTVAGENLGRITALETVKNVCAAAQARETVTFDESRRGAEAGRGVPGRKRGRGVASEVALARRISPSQGSRQLALARALATDLPHTRAKLTAGEVSEWRAGIVLRETGSLTPAGRRHVDAQLAPVLETLGDRRLTRRARALAQAYDPEGAADRYHRAEKDRYVDIDTASDATVHFCALLPAAQGIAAWKALGSHVNTLISTGQTEGRTRSQMMADTLIERLTGQETAAAVPVEVHLVMTDAALLGGDEAPAWVVGHGPLPAATARHLLGPENDGPSGTARAWIRRLFTSPETGQLVAMDSQRRSFDGLLRRMVLLRDDTCRTPWCDAPIRHVDHVRPHAAGGETSYGNASGLCERCNQVKENPGWTHAATPEQLTVTTPTGHQYTTGTLPITRPRGRPPGHPPAHHNPASPLEHHHTRWIDIHWLPHAS